MELERTFHLRILRCPLLMVLGLPEPAFLFVMVPFIREVARGQCKPLDGVLGVDHSLSVSFVGIPIAAQAKALAFSSIEKAMPTLFREITRVIASPQFAKKIAVSVSCLMG